LHIALIGKYKATYPPFVKKISSIFDIKITLSVYFSDEYALEIASLAEINPVEGV
jgi:hypothetical protein